MISKERRRLYAVWKSMHRRCSDLEREHYAAKGISVCPEWQSFSQFLSDMGECPEGYWLDRIDSEQGYSPENCRWVSRVISQVNRRMRKDNTSGYQGVSWEQRRCSWRACIRSLGRTIHIGYYATPEEAAAAYNRVATRFWGDEARLNQLREQLLPEDE